MKGFLFFFREGWEKTRGKKGLRFCSHKAAAAASSLNFEWAKSSVFTTRLSTKCDGKYSSRAKLWCFTPNGSFGNWEFEGIISRVFPLRSAPAAQSLADFRRHVGVAPARRHHHQPGIIAAPFCLSGKCQGVIDIFLTAAFISVPCSRSYDLGSCWPLPVHSFLPYFSSSSGGGGEAYLTENSSIGFRRGVFHFETIFFFLFFLFFFFYCCPFLRWGLFLTQAIYFSLLFFIFFEIQLFSVSFDLRFAPKRFGPLMFVKVILSHSEGGGRGGGGGGRGGGGAGGKVEMWHWCM